MKEITFLKQNNEKWQQFEALLNSTQGQNPDALADLFIRITDDLSWARTFYPGSNTEKYLNSLAARIHQEIYKNKKERRSRLRTFWSEEIPLIMGKHRMNLLIIFLIFIVSTWIGVISAQHDENFVRIILSDGYVDATIERMSHGDPLGIYKEGNEVSMFFQLAIHNSEVALACIVAGMLGWIGVAYMQFFNGVMLGSFLYFLSSYGYYHEAMLTVWIHGVIEISSILVAGAAGLALGQGLYFPGAWPRGVSFMKGAREALKIAIALIPFFFLAAFFEGFITRYNNMNDNFRMLLICSSLTFILWYFIFRPITLARRKAMQLNPALQAQEEKSFVAKIRALFNFFSVGGLLLFCLPFISRMVHIDNNSVKTHIVNVVCYVVGMVFIVFSFFIRDGKLAGVKLSSRFKFLVAIAALLFFLPTLALVMEFFSHQWPNFLNRTFFWLSYLGSAGCIVFAILNFNKSEETDLVIERKNITQAADYEREAGNVKV